MTATKKIYKGSKNHDDDNDDNDDDSDENILCMSDEKIYGPLVYEYNIRDAINDGVLCDYTIEIMVINDEIVEKYKNDKIIILRS